MQGIQLSFFRTMIDAAFNQNQNIEKIKTFLVKQINTKI
jgi:hypothetical protein